MVRQNDPPVIEGEYTPRTDVAQHFGRGPKLPQNTVKSCTCRMKFKKTRDFNGDDCTPHLFNHDCSSHMPLIRIPQNAQVIVRRDRTSGFWGTDLQKTNPAKSKNSAVAAKSLPVKRTLRMSTKLKFQGIQNSDVRTIRFTTPQKLEDSL